MLRYSDGNFYYWHEEKIRLKGKDVTEGGKMSCQLPKRPQMDRKFSCKDAAWPCCRLANTEAHKKLERWKVRGRKGDVKPAGEMTSDEQKGVGKGMLCDPDESFVVILKHERWMEEKICTPAAQMTSDEQKGLGK